MFKEQERIMDHGMLVGYQWKDQTIKWITIIHLVKTTYK